MAENPRTQKTLRPLSVGNIVSSGVQLYRSNLRTYLSLAFVSYLWIFVPVYGWAKYSMISGLISRLAFQELIHQPETVAQARGKVKPRLWSFLSAGIQVVLRMVVIYLIGAILVAITIAVLTAIVPLLGAIAAVPLVIGFLVVLIRFFSRWFVVEVPLAVEPNLNGSQSIDRSWNLTKQSVGRVQVVAVVGFLVTFPLLMLTGYIPSFLVLALPEDSGLIAIANLASFALSLIGGVLVMPFWQAIKAVTYYDLRSRQEGLDLELRGRRA
ncbi:MAG: hypothetical protein ACFB5Z_11925 [Elainellaceae cyanobacterium]